MKTYKLVCRTKGCDTVIEQRVAAAPSEGWHTVNDLGKTVVHLMDVEEPPED